MTIPSRSLPDSPNLEHLRKQAKDLHQAHQAGQADAFERIRSRDPSLISASHAEIRATTFSRTSAQLVVAREYGFASWPQLVQAVESRLPQANGMKAAIERGDGVTITAMLQQHPDLLQQEFDWVDRNGKQRRITPVRYAHACDQRASFDALTAAGATDRRGGLLWSSAYNLDLPRVQWLLARGVSPMTGMEVVQWRIGPGRHAVLEALIEAGGSFEDGPRMDIHRGRLQSLQQRLQADRSLLHQLYEDHLSDCGVIPRPGGAPQQGTLLHIAAAHNDHAFVEMLLEQGADIDALASDLKDGSGAQTPIFFTIGRSEPRDVARQRAGLPAHDTCEESFEALLAHGADLSVRARCMIHGSVAELTPLGYALARQQSDQLHRPHHMKAFTAHGEIERLREVGAPE